MLNNERHIDLFQRARELCAAGKFNDAAKCCHDIVSDAPGHPPATLMLAEIILERGGFDEAISLLEPLTEIAPNSPAGHFCLGNAYHKAGRLEEAAGCLRRAAQLQPSFPGAHNNLGIVLQQLDDRIGAIQAYERAIQLDINLVEARLNLSELLLFLNKVDDAINQLRAAVETQLNTAHVHYRLGVALQRAYRHEESIQSQRNAVAIQADFPEAHIQIGISLCSLSRAEEAISEIRKGLKQRPDLPSGWLALGNALRSLGRFAEAIEAYQQALDLKPNFGNALRGLAAVRCCAADAAQLSRLRLIVADHSQSRDNRASAALALAKILDDSECFDEAFAAAVEGNALIRGAQREKNITYNHSAFMSANDQVIKTFTPDHFAARHGLGAPSQLPVFVVGYFRSGTTLVEQICSSHTGVFGAGELRDIGRLGQTIRRDMADAGKWNPAVVLDYANAHLRRLRELDGAAVRIVDKAPDNIYELGLIATLFPGARVIFCHRDGRDASLSVFFQRFAPEAAFASELVDAGLRWREAERMADHWRKSLPLAMHHVQYEALVLDFENEARKLIHFLGLEWEPACLEFYKTERPVWTPSNWQVRQPIYTSSVGRWRHYRRHLGPLCDAINISKEAPEGSQAIW